MFINTTKKSFKTIFSFLQVITPSSVIFYILRTKGVCNRRYLPCSISIPKILWILITAPNVREMLLFISHAFFIDVMIGQAIVFFLTISPKSCKGDISEIRQIPSLRDVLPAAAFGGGSRSRPARSGGRRKILRFHVFFFFARIFECRAQRDTKRWARKA